MVDQDAFTTALLNPEQPVPTGIIQPDGTPATKRFDVYRNNVVASLIRALGDAYPVIKKLVGVQFFDAMAGSYVRAHPPTSPLMMFYGASFSEFLAGFEPAQQLPYLPDLANLEHARRIAYHAADDPVLDPEALGQIPPDKLGGVRFKFHASMRILTSQHPIFSIWRFNSTDDQSPVVAEPEDVLVNRPQDLVQMRKLPAGGAQFLANLQSGQTLGEAAEAAVHSVQEFDLEQNISGMLTAQIISVIQEQ